MFIIPEDETLTYHIQQVVAGKRRFENAAQAISRMILERGVQKVTRAGKGIDDFTFFREGSRHIIGWYQEINEFVHFIMDAAQGGDARKLAFVLVSEPGSGKTFFLTYLCDKYRVFLSEPNNRRYTFDFIGLDEALGYDQKVARLQSLTFEDPMVLAMNLFENSEENKEFLVRTGLKDNAVEALFRAWRPLGASTEYLWNELMQRYNGDLEQVLRYVRLIPVPMRHSLGITTGKYSAKDKITSSSVDLAGEEDVQRMLLFPPDDPNRINLRRGALARVAGGGIHFADEFFRNKPDLVQMYLQVIENRNIELDAFKWPIDVLIVATSNNDAYNDFVKDAKEAPIKDRCRICYITHNTDYILQQTLSRYAMGENKTTVFGEPLHEDPNLNYAISVAVVLTRLLHTQKLSPIETMKLEAGEIAGDKGVKSLVEVREAANANPDVTKRWGQKGFGHRDLGRALQLLEAMPETGEGKCLYARDVFKALERIILDYVPEATDRDKYMQDLKTARKLYRERVKTAIFNAFREDPDAVRKDVLMYVNMLIGLDSENLSSDKMWRYRDPQTGEIKSIKIDQKFVDSVESRLGLNTNDRKQSYRTMIRKIYAQKIATDSSYDFMDNQELVKAVTDVRLESDVAGAGSLVGALGNRSNEENVKVYNRMVEVMIRPTTKGGLGYCPTCAQKTIEYFCEKEDES